MTTIHHLHSTLLSHGMAVVGLPYAKHSALFDTIEVNGDSVFGATVIAGGDGSRMPNAHELGAAKAQGAWVAEFAEKLSKK